MKDLLAINVLEEELDAGAEFCRRRGIGIELTSFAFPKGLDERFDERLDRHVAAVEGLAQVTFHGPFLDLYVTSPDPAIVSVCELRHRRALSAAMAVGATHYVAHLNSLPLIRNESYRAEFARAAADFWLPFAEEAGARGMSVVLENMWEDSPELQRRVVEEAGHPHLKASFDNGHALVFSEVRASEWIATLGEHLAHCHLHDNDRTYDHHWPVGEGDEDWTALWNGLRRFAPEAVLVLESDHLEANERSLQRILEDVANRV